VGDRLWMGKLPGHGTMAPRPT